MTMRYGPPRRTAGFTLIELLVVIVVIGILAAIAVPVFLNQRNKGYDARAKSEMHTALVAVQTYFVDNGQFPSSDVLMRTLEPSVAWLSSYGRNDVDPAYDTVTFEQANGGTSSTLVVLVRSRSNRCLYMRVVADASMSPAGVSYKSTAAPCRDPWDYSSSITGSTY